jgi:Transposase IS66 family
MDELFAIDAQARQGGLSPIDRHVLRLEKAKPLLEQINAGIQAARAGALPKSALAKACNYTLTLWTRLSRFLEYPELELSNNLAENAMRPVALGRKNWIPPKGGQQGGWATGSRHNFDRRNLSAPELTDSRLPGFGAPGLGRFSDQSSR